MRKAMLKIIIRRIGLLVMLLILGIDLSFAEETDIISNFQDKHPYLFIATLLALPFAWLYFCHITGVDQDIILDNSWDDDSF